MRRYNHFCNHLALKLLCEKLSESNSKLVMLSREIESNLYELRDEELTLYAKILHFANYHATGNLKVLQPLRINSKDKAIAEFEKISSYFKNPLAKRVKSVLLGFLGLTMACAPAVAFFATLGMFPPALGLALIFITPVATLALTALTAPIFNRSFTLWHQIKVTSLFLDLKNDRTKKEKSGGASLVINIYKSGGVKSCY